ncbi:hypothetical protein BH11VER1_BH11VER1_34170 [soil metagenome]
MRSSPQPYAPTSGGDCFAAGWELSVFGTYATPDADYGSGWGGGLGADYFFTKYVGIGADAMWIAVSHETNNSDLTVGNYLVNAKFRLPFQATTGICIAPYVTAGVGFFDTDKTSAEWLGRLGVGVEARFDALHGVGIFGEWDYNLPGGDDLEDYQLIRAGIRIPL